MNIYIRKILLLISYTAFVIIAPLVILYAIGYRPQADTPIPRPVGVILADATPGKASISVNGKLQGTLPRSISNMEPGEVVVQVTKEGYTPWEKRLEIKPTQATDIRSIQLLPASFEKDILAEQVSLYAASPNNLFLAVVTPKNTLSILDDVGGTVIPAFSISGKPTAISWSPDSSHILVTLPKNTYELVRIQNTLYSRVSAKAITGLSQIQWSNGAANTLYGIDKDNSLVSYTIPSATKEVVSKNINTYEVSGRTITYQTQENELVTKQIRTGDQQILIPDTQKAIKSITTSSGGTLALLYTDKELVIRKTNGEFITIPGNAQSALWSPDGKLLLVQTAATELSLYNVENERLFAVPLRQLHTITRLSQPILHPQWFSDSLHILYQTNNTIFFSEIDTRDHAIALPIDVTKSAMPITIGDQSKHIMYIQKDGTVTNLVKTWLLTKEDR